MSQQLQELISNTDLPVPDHLNSTITTRVMTQKQITQIKRDNIEKNSPRSSISRQSRLQVHELTPDSTEKSSPRRSISGQPKFVSGTSINNSTIRSHVDNVNKIKFAESKDTSPKSSNTSRELLEDEEDEGVKRKRLSSLRGLERMRKKIHGSSLSQKENPQEGAKRRRSSVQAVDMVISQTRIRRPTLESIKDAIEKSPDHVTKLVDVDSIERKNIGQHFKVSSTEQQVQGTKNEKIDPIHENITQKKDLQTQTSLLIDKLYVQMNPNSANTTQEFQGN